MIKKMMEIILILMIVLFSFNLIWAKNSNEVFSLEKIEELRDQYVPPKLVRVAYNNTNNVQQLINNGFDVIETDDNYAYVIVFEDDITILNQTGFEFDTVYENYPDFLRSQKSTSAMGDYKTLDELEAYMDTLHLDHPNIVAQKISIGMTIDSLNMYAIKISDNDAVCAECTGGIEPEVLYYAGIHAREVITPEVLIYFMDHLTDNYGVDQEITDIVNNRELWFVLMVNPDGYYYNELSEPEGGGMWRKNRRDNGDGQYGVDLNRNYGYKWGATFGSSGSTMDNNFRGTAPFSEPESQNMRDFIESHNFVISVSYHSYSDLIMYPWGYHVEDNPDNNIYSFICDSISTLNNYDPGMTSDILYFADGGSLDWEYGEQTTKNKIYSFIFEVGGGGSSESFWPEANSINGLVSENLQPNIFLAKIADNLEVYEIPNKPSMSGPIWTDLDSFTVNISHVDAQNPKEVFQLEEYTNYSEILQTADDSNGIIMKGFVFDNTEGHSGNTSFYSTLAGDNYRYIQFENPLTVRNGDTLSFWIDYRLYDHILAVEHYTYAYVEISTDQETFVPIDGNITTNDNPYNLNRGNGITGNSNGWVEAKFDLSNYASQSVYIRISSLQPTYLTNKGGVRIDDIQRVPVFGNSTVLSSTLTANSYTLTNKQLGFYNYQSYAQDSEDQWSHGSNIPSIYLYDSTCCIGIAGNVDNDEIDQISITDLMYLIDFMFNDGPIPLCPPEANMDGSVGVTVDITDLVWLVDYMFNNGPPPVICQ